MIGRASRAAGLLGGLAVLAITLLISLDVALRFFLNRPLLFVDDGVFGSLSKSMPRIVEAIREVIGDTPFTVVFDRGGYQFHGRVAALAEAAREGGLDF